LHGKVGETKNGGKKRTANTVLKQLNEGMRKEKRAQRGERNNRKKRRDQVL